MGEQCGVQASRQRLQLRGQRDMGSRKSPVQVRRRRSPLFVQRIQRKPEPAGFYRRAHNGAQHAAGFDGKRYRRLPSWAPNPGDHF